MTSTERQDIKTAVTFSFSEKAPFASSYDPTITLGVVRKAAMDYFGAEEDPAHVFYLSHDRQRQDDGRTVGQVAGHAEAVTFRLVKELVQG